MRGLMAERQLLISTLIRHAARYHGDVEIVSRLVDRTIHRYTYAEAERRSRRLAQALLRLGIGPATGSARWHGTISAISSCITASPASARCATRSTRACSTSRSSISSTTRATGCCLSKPALSRWSSGCGRDCRQDCRIVLLEPAETSLPVLATHDELVAAESEDGFDWPEFDEWTASALCYTSGTTGKPKGVLYTPSLDPAACLWRVAAGRHPGVEPRHDLPGRADVPRLRLERAVLRADERRQAGAARSASRRRQPLRAVRGRGGDAEPRRADRVARLRGASGRDRGALFDLSSHPVGRRRRCRRR